MKYLKPFFSYACQPEWQVALFTGIARVLNTQKSDMQTRKSRLSRDKLTGNRECKHNRWNKLMIFDSYHYIPISSGYIPVRGSSFCMCINLAKWTVSLRKKMKNIELWRTSIFWEELGLTFDFAADVRWLLLASAGAFEWLLLLSVSKSSNES